MNFKNSFTIIEILVVIVILAILSITAIPTWLNYTKKISFAEVIQATRPYKLAVETCYQAEGGGAMIANCGNGDNGVPAKQAATGNVASIVTSPAGVITAKGQNKAPADSYILTPTPANNRLAWEISGTCVTNGSC